MSTTTSIEVVTGGASSSPAAIRAAERLLLLEDIEEEQNDWLELNRAVAHVTLGLAQFADALTDIGPSMTIDTEWLKWRRLALESIINPTQVTFFTAPYHRPVTVPAETAATPNTMALRRAYADEDWLRDHRGKWVVVHGGKIYPNKFDAHEDALGFAMDAHGMLGNYVCPYVSDVYCDYKMRIYESQAAFAEDIRDL
jgi:hypothetical protein